MPIQRVGHVVIRMRNLEEAKRFYGGILGMAISGEREDAVFFRFADYHHDIAVFKAAPDAEDYRPGRLGLEHLALVADSFETVREWYARLKAAGVPGLRAVDHGFTRSIYFRDPDGNEIEIYAENPEFNWREKGVGRTNRPLDLDAEGVPASAEASG